jgi:hypothetical protein
MGAARPLPACCPSPCGHRLPPWRVGQRVDAVEHRVHSVEHRVHSVEHRVHSVEHRVHSVEHRVHWVEHRVHSVEHRVHWVEHRVHWVEHRVHSVEHRVHWVEHRVHSVEHRVHSVEHRVHAVDPSSPRGRSIESTRSIHRVHAVDPSLYSTHNLSILLVLPHISGLHQEQAPKRCETSFRYPPCAVDVRPWTSYEDVSLMVQVREGWEQGLPLAFFATEPR